MMKATNFCLFPRKGRTEIQPPSLSFPNGTCCFPLRLLFATMICTAPGLLLSGNHPAMAQTFEEALNAQLARDPTTELGCARLVGGSPRNGADLPLNFGSELQGICGLLNPGSGPPPIPNSSTGSGTPAVGYTQQRGKDIREGKCGGEEECVQAGKGGTSSSTGLGNGVSVFFSGQYQDFERDSTKFEDGYSSDIWTVTVGTDVLLKDWGVAGLAFNYSRWNADYNGGGRFNTNSYSPIVYASFFPREDLFIDVSISYAWENFSNNRLRSYTNELNNELRGKISSNQKTWSSRFGLLLGYDTCIDRLRGGDDCNNDPFTFGPRLGIDYVSTDLGGYTEQGNTGLELVYDKNSRNSMQTKIGLESSMAISMPLGAVVPNISGFWIHESAFDQLTTSVRFAQDNRSNPAKFSFQGDKPDRNFFQLGAGAVWSLPYRIQALTQFSTIQGHKFIENYSYTVNLRFDLEFLLQYFTGRQ